MGEQTPYQKITKVRELIRDVRCCMLSTVNENGRLHSRPMLTLSKSEFTGYVWLFTYADSHKVFEIDQNHQVNLSFARPDKDIYVSLSGTAELVRDPETMRRLWTPVLRAWFPGGLGEPDLALLKVTVREAEYWDATSGFTSYSLGILQALLTGEGGKFGEHETVSL